VPDLPCPQHTFRVSIVPVVSSDDAEAPPSWSGTARAVRGRDVVDEVSAGFAAGPASEPCSADLRFQAGSISKLVLSAVVLALTEKHGLDLGQPIRRWLSKPSADWRAITLHQLLSHTSGLGHWPDIPGLPSLSSAPPPSHDEIMDMIRRAPLVHQPGEAWHYSGPGYLLAAQVAEAASQTAYQDLVADLVIAPAGLRSTTSGEFPIGSPLVATGHRAHLPITVHPGFTDLPGTGDLWTTTDDLIRLSQALRSEAVLHRRAAAQLWTPYASLDASPGATTSALVATDAYGYGTFLGRVKGQRARINPGDNPGYQSLLAYLPDSDTDIAVLCNLESPSVSSALGQLDVA